VPDDAALALAYMLLRGLDGKILMHARQFFYAAIEEDKIMHQLDDAVVAAEFEEIFVELESSVVLLVLFPLEEVFFRRANGGISQPLGFIAREDELHRRKEPGVKFGLLVREALPYAVANGSAAVL
jgi:hypothetical protein